MRVRLLLFGGSGQLGLELMNRARDLNFEMFSPVQSEVDVTEREQIVRLAEKSGPQVIINCAAYTAVDNAEEEKDLAFRVNCDGALNAALAAKACGARLIHISTDYVFDGSASVPIPEDAPTQPLSVYGSSKLAGERAVLDCLGDKALVVRTSSLHGQHGANFVHTMVKLFKERDQVQIVDDQFMSPTWAGWLAEVLLDLCRIECHGVLHACGAGVCSWYDFASAIYQDMNPLLRREVSLVRVRAADYVRPAKRPAYSAMSTAKLTALLARPALRWREGLASHLSEIRVLAEGAEHEPSSERPDVA